MSQHPSEMEYSTMTQKPKKGWFGRNWLWFIPLVVLLPIICCCGGFGALIWFGIGAMTDLEPYKDSIVEVQQDPDITAALGTPIPAPGIFETMQSGGNMDATTSGGATTLTATIPMSGPNDSGTLYVEASSPDGVTWTYTTREFTVDSTGETFYLPGSPEAGQSNP